MATEIDYYEWTCDGCGNKYRLDVEKTRCKNLARFSTVDVKCKCGGDRIHRADFSGTESLRILKQPEGTTIMVAL